MISLKYLISLFLFSLPFQFALSPAGSLDLPLGRVLSGVIILWWLVRGLLRKNIELPSLLFTGAILSFCGLTIVSLLWAENTEFALRKAFFILNYLPLLFVFFDVGREKDTVVAWTKALCMGAGGTALVGIGIFANQFLFGVEKVFAWLVDTLPFFLGSNLGQTVTAYPSLLVNISGTTLLRVTSFFPDPHVAAFYFGMSGFLALALFFREKQKVFLVVSGVLFLTDLLTFSRGGYVGLLAGALFFLVFAWRTFPPHMKKWLVRGLLAFAILVLLLGQPIIARFSSSFTLEDTSSTGRVELWQTAWENIEGRPFVGTGIGNYIVAVRPLDDYRTPYYAHNLYLDIATELGLTGLFFFLLILFIPLFVSVRNYVQTKDIVSLCIASALVLYLTHSLFETALYSVHTLPLLVFILALSLILSDQRKKANAVAQA